MEGTVLSHVLDVFSGIGTWIAEAVNSLIPMFYVAETGLTFIGVLTVAGLGIAITLLLVSQIRNFLRFK